MTAPTKKPEFREWYLLHELDLGAAKDSTFTKGTFICFDDSKPELAQSSKVTILIEHAALVAEREKVKRAQAIEETERNRAIKTEKENVALNLELQQLKEKLETAEKAAQAQAEKLHVFQCAIDEVFNNKHLRNNSVLTSNPPQNGGVWDLRNAVTQLLKASK